MPKRTSAGRQGEREKEIEKESESEREGVES